MLQPLPIDGDPTLAPECPTCGAPVTVIDRFTLAGSPGPVEHVKISCAAGHRFTVPTDWFARTREQPRDPDAGRRAARRGRRVATRTREGQPLGSGR